MTRNKIIHIKLDSDEALGARRSVLSTEMDLVNIAKAVNKYKQLKARENDLKILVKKQIKDLKNDFRKLKTVLPKLEIPKILKKHEDEMHSDVEVVDLDDVKKRKEKIKKEKTKKSGKKTKHSKVKKQSLKPSDDFERQLAEIQGRLNKLG